MKTQTATITLAPSAGEKFYSFKRLSDTIGLDNQWVPVQFAAPGDMNAISTVNSLAKLRRHGDDCALITQSEFCNQTGIDSNLVLTFETRYKAKSGPVES